jgi:hypothetical protein
MYAATTGLYISRTSSTTFDLGYTMATGDTIAISLTFSGSNPLPGGAVGLFADVRAVTTYGDLDNLRIPEPATIALLGLGGLLLRRKRA